MIQKLCFIDLETSGLDPKINGVTQVSGIIEIDGKEVERFNVLACPPPALAIDTRALEVQGRTRADLDKHMPYAEAYITLQSLFCQHVDKFNKRDKMFFIGYNARFDDDFLREFYLFNGDKYYNSMFFYPPIDVMNMAIVYMMNRRHELPNFRLTTVAQALNIPVDLSMAHDAFYDITLTKRVFETLKG